MEKRRGYQQGTINLWERRRNALFLCLGLVYEIWVLAGATQNLFDRSCLTASVGILGEAEERVVGMYGKEFGGCSQ